MQTTVVIEQPNYIPWIGYFDLMQQSDVWVWYDDVQYTKRDWRNRNRVAVQESITWLTIPVKTKGRYEQTIAETEIDDGENWAKRHLETLRHCYADAPYFDLVHAALSNAFSARPRYLADLTIGLNETICRLLGYERTFQRSSAILKNGDRNARLIEICRDFGATTYLSGPAAQSYLDSAAFAEAGIEVRYIVYDYPPYDRGPNPFIANLSIVDALAWLGPEGTAAYLAAYGCAAAAGGGGSGYQSM